MGFSVKLAPGVRVRASSRGVRTSLGPRAARVHVGGGRTGFSTGVGPVGYYTSVGGSSRSTARRTSGAGSATASRQLAAAQRAADKADEARALRDALVAIFDLHRGEFAAAQPPVAPPLPPVDVAAIHAKHAKEAKAGTSVFSRAARKNALAEATQRAQAEVAHVNAHYEQERQAWQTQLNEQWAALNRNDPDTVLATLAEAFEDNDAAAAAVGVDGSEVTLVVVVPGASSIPDRKPTTTAAGNLSLKKLTKSETADMYKHLVCGHVLVTLKEAFAVAPAISHARIVALRATGPDAYGKVKPEVMLAARFERISLHGIQWGTADAVQVVNDAATEKLLAQKGASKELVSIELKTEPELADVVDAVDFEELL
ncbi:DUF4236 domain-containing protein [Nocardioides sp. HB32]